MEKITVGKTFYELKGPVLFALSSALSIYFPAGFSLFAVFCCVWCLIPALARKKKVLIRRILLCIISLLVGISVKCSSEPVSVSSDYDFSGQLTVRAYKDSLMKNGAVYSYLQLPTGLNLTECQTDKVLYQGERACADFSQFHKKNKKVLLSQLESGKGLWSFRSRLLRSAQAAILLFPEHTRGIFWALFTGRKDFLTDLSKKWFASAGLSHILALSGMHILIWTALISFLLLPIPSKTLRFLMFIAMLAFLLFLTCAPDSLIRAFMAAMILHVLILSGRKIKPLDLLALVFTVQCLAFPSAAFQIGFQLSYAACAGLILISPALERRLEFSPSFIRKPLATGYGAMSFSSLISVPAFGQFSPHSLYLTPIAGLFSALIWAAGLVCVIVLSFCPAIGILVRWFLALIEACLDFCFRFRMPVLVLDSTVKTIVFSLVWILPAFLTAPHWARSFFHVDIRGRFLGQDDVGGKGNGRPKKPGTELFD